MPFEFDGKVVETKTFQFVFLFLFGSYNVSVKTKKLYCNSIFSNSISASFNNCSNFISWP
jgi:hypothetical protein